MARIQGEQGISGGISRLYLLSKPQRWREGFHESVYILLFSVFFLGPMSPFFKLSFSPQTHTPPRRQNQKAGFSRSPHPQKRLEHSTARAGGISEYYWIFGHRGHSIITTRRYPIWHDGLRFFLLGSSISYFSFLSYFPSFPPTRGPFAGFLNHHF